MTPFQLQALDAACQRSMRDADSYLDQLIGDGGCATKGNIKPGNVGRRVYVVERIGIDFQATDSEAATRAILARHMQVAGLGPALQREREAEQEAHSGSSDSRVPQEDWVLDAMRPSAPADPDVQALACLRLLQARTLPQTMPWMYRAAARRLVDLLLQYPVLMHPRMVWDVAPRRREGVALSDQVMRTARVLAGSKGDNVEAAPMMHIILGTTAARLPAEHLGVDAEALLRFDLHPAVAAGIKARAPHLIESNPTRKPFTWGKTIGDKLLDSQAIHCVKLTSLLRIERRRHEAGHRASLFKGSSSMLSGIRNAITLAFTHRWTRGGGTGDWLAPGCDTGFLKELATSPTLSATAIRPSLMGHLGKVFDDFTSNSATTAATSDAPARFERLLPLLVRTGVFANEREASVAVFNELFPVPVHSWTVPQPSATVEVAHQFLQRWRCDGIPLGTLAQRVRQGSSGSSWSQVVTILETEQAMSDVIVSTGINAMSGPVEAPAARARRNRAV